MFNRLITNGITYDDEYIYGGVEYNSSVNPDTDLQYGVCASASIKFTIDQQLNIGDQVQWDCWMLDRSGYETRGFFYVKDIEHTARDKWTHTCYDIMSALDVNATRWFKTWLVRLQNGTTSDATTFTLNDVINAVASQYAGNIGLFVRTSIISSNLSLQFRLDTFLKRNGWMSDEALDPTGRAVLVSDMGNMPLMTARQILSYACAMAGCFARVTRGSGETIIVIPYARPNAGTTSPELDLLIPYSMRFGSDMTEADYVVENIEGIDVMGSGAVKDSARASGLISGEEIPLYIVEDNPFNAYQGNQTPAANLLTSISSLYGINQMYKPFTMRLINDYAVSSIGQSIVQGQIIQNSNQYTSFSIIVGSAYVIDDSGNYCLSGTITQGISLGNLYAELGSGVYYAISSQVLVLSPSSEIEWQFKGTNCYEISISSDNFVYSVRQLTVNRQRLDEGEIFQYDDLFGSISFYNRLLTTRIDTLNSNDIVIMGNSYSQNDNGTFSILGISQKRADAWAEGSYYAASYDIKPLNNAGNRSGQYLYEVTVGPGLLFTSKVYRATDSRLTFGKNYGIVMTKKITPRGVYIEATGTKLRKETEIYG